MPRIPHGLEKGSLVLVVDDSPAILALMRDLLRARGYGNVRTAQTAAEGLEIVERDHPALIFLDLMMPDTSGIEFTRAALEKSPDSRIVLTTALPPTHEAVTMAVSQGASEYLGKPLRGETLSHVLEHLAHPGNGEDVGYG